MTKPICIKCEKEMREVGGTSAPKRCIYCQMIEGSHTGSPEQVKCNHRFEKVKIQ